jgi:hypothetical protein
MPDLWMPGAVRADVGGHAPCDTQYPAKAVAHITWDKNATPSKPVDLVPFANLKAYFTGSGVGMAPHILWDPFAGTFVQFYPADSRSKSVVDLAGGTRTNRAGKVVIQVEALFFPYCKAPDGKVYAELADTPCKGWQQLQDWVTSWGVPEAWPMGRPTDFSPHRSEHVWETEGGWYGHSQVPENTHVDPGSWPSFITPKPAPKPVYEPFPGASFFTTGRKSPIIKAMHARLVAVGCNHYASAANADIWGPGDERSYAAWQRKLNYTGTDANGTPGPTSWAKLHVPNV